MTRNVHLIRAILRRIQQSKNAPVQAPIEIAGYDPEAINLHLDLLHREGFIDAQKTEPLNGPSVFLIKDLTWKGHDLAGALGNEAVWGHLNERFSGLDLASMPIGVLEHMARELTAQWAKKKAGL